MFEESSLKRLEQLSQLFAHYKIYPQGKFTSDSPLRYFQRIYPNNHYSIEAEEFLTIHNYEPTKRGADLPWWGKDYFCENREFKVMIISQDSLSKDAGSIVFFAQLFPVVNSDYDYSRYLAGLNNNQQFRIASWRTIKNYLYDWNINLDNCYITDAAKVYKVNSWKDRDFDKQKSKELLEKEIDTCNPDLIILLGAAPLDLLKKEFKYSEVVGSGKRILIRGKETVVSPFLTGNAPTQSNFKERLAIAAALIRERVS